MTIYMEGGGQDRALKDQCRRGLRDFITKLGLKGHMPRISACSSRVEAYKKYCISLSQNKPALLLVDSEEVINAAHQKGDDPMAWSPWGHLAQRADDHWETPKDAAETDCHLMVQVMETWFLADPKTLAAFFGKTFKANQLNTKGRALESIPKKEVLQNLNKAVGTQHKGYHKGAHAFKILAELNPDKVAAASPWAARFFAVLRERVS